VLNKHIEDIQYFSFVPVGQAVLIKVIRAFQSNR